MTYNDHEQARLALETLRLYSEYEAESDDLKDTARGVLLDYFAGDANAEPNDVGGGPVGRKHPNDVNEPHA